MDVHSLRFATDNAFDIPTLDIDMQAESVAIPCRAWGSASRKRWHRGGWHFYVDDYRFSALLTNPQTLIDTNPLYACEPNISIGEQSSRAEVIWNTYRKRWLSAFWQLHGVPIFADLNVPPNHLDINGIGIPPGWRVFSTRGYESEPSWLESQYEFAKSIHESPLLLVVGGGDKIVSFCHRHRCVHLGYMRRMQRDTHACNPTANPCSHSEMVRNGR